MEKGDLAETGHILSSMKESVAELEKAVRDRDSKKVEILKKKIYALHVQVDNQI